MPHAPGTYCFGRWQLDTQRRTLRAGGAPVPLNGRAFDLLTLLVSCRDRVVSREEIVAHVWQGLAVGENNLTVQMSTLRRILAEKGGDTLIVTVPGRGYQFTGDVATLSAPAVVDPASPPVAHTPTPAQTAPVGVGRGRVILAASFTAALLLASIVAALTWHHDEPPPRLSIAVLPLRNLSADHAQDHLADALTDDLTTDLAHIPASTVIARESAEVYRDQRRPAQEIGTALHVRYLVQGSVMIDGGLYHVTAQIIDTATGAHLWASRFDYSQGTLPEVRDSIVHRLASALGFQLEQIESVRSLNDRPNNPDALDLFLRARALLDLDLTLSRLTQAQRLLEEAIMQEPKFGDALAELGSMLLTKVHDMDDPTADADFDEARKMIRRALAIAPRNARALAAQGRAFSIQGRWADAFYSAKAALEIEPSSVEAEAVLSACAQAAGKLDEAVEHLQAILRLSPSSASNRPRFVALGFILLVQGRLEEAVDKLRQAIASDEDREVEEGMGRVEITRLLLIAANELLGKTAEARREFDSYQAIWPNRTVWRFAELFNRAYANKPGFVKIMDALTLAGMRRYADEHTAARQTAPACPGTEFDLTPERLQGGQTWDTALVADRLRSPDRLLLIDLGRGVASPNAAIWYDEATTSEMAADFAVEQAHNKTLQHADTTVVIMGDGLYGCAAYKVAQHLVTVGYRNVAWYRGGEESWAAAQLPSIDRRP